MQHLKELFDYDIWATRRLLDQVLALNEPSEKLLELSAHILQAQQYWILRIQGNQTGIDPWQPVPKQKFLALLERNRDELAELMNNYAHNRPVHYQIMNGEYQRNTLAEILHHLLLHSAYHRGQIAQLLAPMVPKVPSTDFIFYVRDLEV